MKRLALLLIIALAVAGCGNNRPEHRVLLLQYQNPDTRKAEEDRVNALLVQGWRVVSTDTVMVRDNPISGGSTSIQGNDFCSVTMVLEK